MFLVSFFITLEHFCLASKTKTESIEAKRLTCFLIVWLDFPGWKFLYNFKKHLKKFADLAASFTAWKMSKYGVFSGPYSVRMWENTDQKKLRIWTLFTQWEATMKTYKATKIKEMHLWWRPFYNKIPSLAEFFRKTFSQNSCEQLVLTTDNRKVMKTLKLSKIRM